MTSAEKENNFYTLSSKSILQKEYDFSCFWKTSLMHTKAALEDEQTKGNNIVT